MLSQNRQNRHEGYPPLNPTPLFRHPDLSPPSASKETVMCCKLIRLEVLSVIVQ